MVVSMASWAPSEQGQPVCHNLESSAIQDIEGREVQVSHEDVCGHASSGLPADLSCGHLQRISTASQNPRLGARCTMMAKRLKLAATSAGTQSQRKGEMQPSAKKNAERLGVNSRRPGRGKCSERN